MGERQCEGCGTALTRRQKRFCSVSCTLRTIGRGKGKNAPHYNGGLYFDRYHGRWIIFGIDKSRTFFSRAVMEAQIQRPLRRGEVVHHKNGDPTDDRPENLELLSVSEHVSLHRRAA